MLWTAEARDEIFSKNPKEQEEAEKEEKRPQVGMPLSRWEVNRTEAELLGLRGESGSCLADRTKRNWHKASLRSPALDGDKPGLAAGDRVLLVMHAGYQGIIDGAILVLNVMQTCFLMD
ncbi:hypothetical protein CB1_012719009 [Camelus ferus]|nr:hypothetical protein CB1_012719009 [Camelus ferus]